MWANVIAPEETELLVKEKCFSTNRGNCQTINALFPGGKLHNPALLSVILCTNTLMLKSNRDLEIIPDVAFVVHVELVVLKQHGHGIGLTERKVEK